MCSIRAEKSSFYRSGRWLWGGARVAGVVVGPGLRRGKEWARLVAAVLAKMTRVIVAQKRLCRDGALDGKVQCRGG